MKTIKKLKDLKTAPAILDGTQAVIFKLNTLKEERHHWIRRELVRSL